MKTSSSGVRTSEMLRKIQQTKSIVRFINSNSEKMEDISFADYITELCTQMDMVPERIIKAADIERSYGHQLFRGTRLPSRDKAIQLAFGFSMDLDDTQKLLRIADKSTLYPKIKRDAAIIFCINNEKTIIETNALLFELGLTIIGGIKDESC